MEKYITAYLVIGMIFAAVMIAIDAKAAKDEQTWWRRVPLSVCAMICLAWPVAATAFVYGLLSHGFGRAADDEAR